MRSILIRSKKFLIKSVAIYILVVVLLILVLLIVKVLFNSYRAKLPIYNPSVPAESIHVDKPFVSEVSFNNVLGQTTFLDGIVKLIDQSQKTLEIAVFSLNSPRVEDAIYRAYDRGVDVTLVLDLSHKDKHTAALEKMPKGIKRVDVGTYNDANSLETTYMHHKFILVDRGTPNAKMLTGSMDFTDKGEKYEESFYVTTSDESLIGYYGKIFDLLKDKVHGISKLNKDTYNPWLAHIQYSDSYINLLVGPGYQTQSVKYQIINLIEHAQNNIKVLMWQFTDGEIAAALVKQAEKGVKVTVIADDLTAEDASSAIPYLKRKAAKENPKNLNVLLDEKSKTLVDLSQYPSNFNPFIHHHEMIVDDKTLVLGTANWTLWGFDKNDEDTMITDNKYLVSEFEKTFQYFQELFKN